MKETKDKLKIVCIETKNNGVFIQKASTPNVYYYDDLKTYLINGAVPESTAVEKWYKVSDIPERIEKVSPSRKVIKGYKLKLGYIPSEKLPSEVAPDYFNCDEDDDKDQFRIFYDEIAEEIPQENINFEFELHVIAERDTWEPIRTDFKLTHGLIDQLTIDPILLPERPCKLDSQQSYKLIRAHIKTNINPKYARVTSDYDFCFAVSKVIPLSERVPYSKNIAKWNAKKPKYVTDYRLNRDVQVFECGPKDQYGKVYQGYTGCIEFSGSSYEDLQVNIDSYLKELIDKINEPIYDCPHCKGTGVILEKIKS